MGTLVRKLRAFLLPCVSLLLFCREPSSKYKPYRNTYNPADP